MNRRDFLKSAAAAVALGAAGGLITARCIAADKAPVKPRGPQLTRRRYKNTNLMLPLLGFGTMRLPQKNGGIDDSTAQKMVDRAMEAGLNYFDTAWPYHGGESETFVGNALRKYPRDSYYLADKLPVWSIGSLREAEQIFERQLRKCRTEYFDFYLLHALNGSGWRTVQEHKLFEFAERMRQEGKIRRIGFSFHDSPELLNTIAAAHPWDFVLLQINYLDWYQYRSREQYEIATKLGIPVMVMEPLRGGTLASLTPAAAQILRTAVPEASTASWAFRYVASLPNVITVLSGMSEMAHLEENIGTFAPFKPLTDRERLTLDSALAAYRKTDSIPCTACAYCIPCPAGVEIPRIFGAYNQYKISGNRETLEKTLAALPAGSGPAGCVTCGKCVTHCPQKINIPEQLKKIQREQQG